MDAIEYLKRRGRMCESIDECIYCPIYLTAMEGGASMHLRDLWEVNDCHFWEQDNSEQAAQAVEEWSKENPIKTNAQKFEEVFGIAPTQKVCLFLECNENGGGFVDGELGGCAKCKLNNWWDEPYKEPEHE